MESHFPRCVHCLAPLSAEGGLVGVLQSLLRRPLRCSSCGTKVSLGDAKAMAESFAVCMGRFHGKLQRAVGTLPLLNQAEAQSILGAAGLTKDLHRIHGHEELCRIVSRNFRAAFQHEALGHETRMRMEALQKAGISRAIKIYARQEKASSEILLRIARIGADDFLVFENHGENLKTAAPGGAAPPAERAGVIPQTGMAGA